MPGGIKPGHRWSNKEVPPPRVFEEIVLPHLDAAFNYARWLTRRDAEAEDVVQDACVRAMRFLPSFRGEDARAWLFTIVRNTWYSRVTRRPAAAEPLPSDNAVDAPTDEALDPEATLLQRRDVARVREALEQLPVDFREVIVLREIEGMSYKEIAEVVHVPIGTVMSRIARGARSAGGGAAVLVACCGAAAVICADVERDLDPVRRPRALAGARRGHSRSPRRLRGLPPARRRTGGARPRGQIGPVSHGSGPAPCARGRTGEADAARRALCWHGRPPSSWSLRSAEAGGRSSVQPPRAGASGADVVVAEVVNAHVRSLQAEHLFDVQSTDQHTVKPWFLGKLDFAPPVADLAAMGFPLVGGRLDYVSGRPVAALVYQRQKHSINVFVWPASETSGPDTARSVRGFHVHHWIRDGMSFWVVSDLNDAELSEFARALQSS